MVNYIEMKAPAKINLGLFVTSKRDDNFHNLETIFLPLNDLYDEIQFLRSDKFSFTADIKELESEDNLIIKAKNLLEIQSGKKINVKVKLKKIIPVGGGLGGGSSDAAATLLALNDMFSLNYNFDTLKNFALNLGSDVPFFIKPFPSFAKSRGEELSVLDLNLRLPVLIVNPNIHVSTKLAYQNIVPQKPEFDLSKLTQSEIDNPETLREKVLNDFEKFVFENFPEVKNVKNKLYEYGAKFALMSGSGSTVFGIFSDIESAEKARNNFPKEYFTFISFDA